MSQCFWKKIVHTWRITKHSKPSLYFALYYTRRNSYEKWKWQCAIKRRIMLDQHSWDLSFWTIYNQVQLSVIWIAFSCALELFSLKLTSIQTLGRLFQASSDFLANHFILWCCKTKRHRADCSICRHTIIIRSNMSALQINVHLPLFTIFNTNVMELLFVCFQHSTVRIPLLHDDSNSTERLDDSSSVTSGPIPTVAHYR